MNSIDDLARDFLDQECIAVAGVSEEHPESPANLIYRTLRQRGHVVFAVNPHLQELMGDRCYPDLASLPERPDGLVIVTRPEAAENLVRQCIETGVPRVWMHCMLGTRPRFLKHLAESIGSVSPEAVRLCHENGIDVIPGSCPMQFLGEDFPHTCMRGLLRVTGALAVPA